MKSRIVVLIFILALMGCSHKYINAEKKMPAGMVYIPGGWFEMGSIGDEGRVGMTIGVDEMPRHRVYVKDYYIDRYEVTNTQFLEFVIMTNNPYRPSHWKEVGTFLKGEDNHAVVDVDWMDADDYCRWAGKRLPTEAEWEKAARGTDLRLWPWGNEYNPDKTNTREGGIGWTAPVGSHHGDVSPYGVYDMAGNAREWVEDMYYPYPGNKLNPNRYTFSFHILRGGSFLTSLNRYARTASRFADVSDVNSRGFDWHTELDRGFRCAKEL